MTVSGVNLDNVELRAALESLIDGALVLSDTITELVLAGDLALAAEVAVTYQDARRQIRRLRALLQGGARVMPSGIPGSKAPHGTEARYRRDGEGGCRCSACTRAHTEYLRAYNGQKSREAYFAAVEAQHGTESRYTSRRWRCRCDECRDAARIARRGRGWSAA